MLILSQFGSSAKTSPQLTKSALGMIDGANDDASTSIVDADLIGSPPTDVKLKVHTNGRHVTLRRVTQATSPEFQSDIVNSINGDADSMPGKNTAKDAAALGLTG
jgi:hypothetical protein